MKPYCDTFDRLPNGTQFEIPGQTPIRVKLNENTSCWHADYTRGLGVRTGSAVYHHADRHEMVVVLDRRSGSEDRRLVNDAEKHQARGMDACRAKSGRRTGDADRFILRTQAQGRTFRKAPPKPRIMLPAGNLVEGTRFYVSEHSTMGRTIRYPLVRGLVGTLVWIQDRRSGPANRREKDRRGGMASIMLYSLFYPSTPPFRRERRANPFDARRQNIGRRASDAPKSTISMEIHVDTKQAEDAIAKLKTKFVEHELFEVHRTQLKDLTAQMQKLNGKVADLEATTGGLWKTQDGTLMQIRQMSDNHLANSIKLCEQRPSFRSESLDKLRAEQERRRMDKVWQERSAKVAVDLETSTMDFNTMRTCAAKFMNPATGVAEATTFGERFFKRKAELAEARAREAEQRLAQGTRAGTGRTTRMLDAAIAAFDSGRKVLICGANYQERTRLWDALIERLQTSTVRNWQGHRGIHKVWVKGHEAEIKVGQLPPPVRLDEIERDLSTVTTIFVDHFAAERALRARFPKLFEQIDR